MSDSSVAQVKGAHRIMVEAAVNFLKSLGASEIVFEHYIGEAVRVDLFAKSPLDETILVECGGVQNMNDRLKYIATKADIVYWLPVLPLIFKLEARDMDSYAPETGVLKCLVCGYEWEPLVEKPLCCPSCKSKHWSTGGLPRKRRLTQLDEKVVEEASSPIHSEFDDLRDRIREASCCR